MPFSNLVSFLGCWKNSFWKTLEVQIILQYFDCYHGYSTNRVHVHRFAFVPQNKFHVCVSNAPKSDLHFHLHFKRKREFFFSSKWVWQWKLTNPIDSIGLLSEMRFQNRLINDHTLTDTVNLFNRAALETTCETWWTDRRNKQINLIHSAENDAVFSKLD